MAFRFLEGDIDHSHSSDTDYNDSKNSYHDKRTKKLNKKQNMKKIFKKIY